MLVKAVVRGIGTGIAICRYSCSRLQCITTTRTKTRADRRTALTGLLSRAPGNAKGTRPRPASALARQPTSTRGVAHPDACAAGEGGPRQRREGSAAADAGSGGKSRHADVSAEEDELRESMAKLAGRLAEIQSARARESRA